MTNNYNEPLECGIIFGRFQPLTKGHLLAINYMSKQVKTGIIYIVKGRKTSTNLEKNPFDIDIQIQMLKSILPINVRIEVTDTGFYPDIINGLENKRFKIFTGSDRFKEYNKMKQYVTEKEVSIIEIPRKGLNENKDISATKVREALRKDDFKTFTKLTPLNIHKFYKYLKNEIQKNS